MRLLHVVPTYIPAYRYGGPIYSVHGLCRGLAARGHDVQVFTTNVDGPGDSDVPLQVPVIVDGVTVRYFPSTRLRRLYWSPTMGAALRTLIAGFDAVHLHSVFLWPTLAGARGARAAEVPYILSPRGMLVPELVRRKSRWLKTAWIALIERQNLERAAAVHVTSAEEMEELTSFGFRLPTVWEVPNGVDGPVSWASDQVSPEVSRVISQGPFLLILGRVSWKKGIDRALHALTLVPSVPLVIAGNDDEGYTAQLRTLAGELGVSDRVFFIGPVEGADKESLLVRAALLLLPSYSENFGNVVLEAMIRGCPVVATPEVGAATVVAAAEAGLVRSGEPEILAGAVRDLLGSADLRRTQGERGRAWARRYYSWETIAERMERLYETLPRPRVG